MSTFLSEGKEEETQPTNMDRVSPFDESKQEETDIALNLKQQLSDGKICKQGQY